MRKIYDGKEYFTKQARLLAWYVANGHSELEFVKKYARLYALHHKGVYE